MKNFLYRRKVIKEIKQRISQHQIEIIHSFYAVPYAFWAYHVHFKNHIVTTRGSDVLVDYKIKFHHYNNFKERIISYFLKRIFKNALLNAKFITSTSIRQITEIKKIVPSSEKLKLVRTGVDVKNFTNIYEKLHTQKSNHITVFSNRAIGPLYNIDLIIDAFCLLRKNIKNCIVKLVQINYYGSKEYYRYIQNKIDSLPEFKDDITMLPDQSFPDLLQIYKNSDIIISIPSSDGTPVSSIESMLAKKPLIIGNISYDEDLFNENTVWKICSFSETAIYQKMKEVIESSEEIKQKKTETAYNIAIQSADFKKEMKKIDQLYYALRNNKN